MPDRPTGSYEQSSESGRERHILVPWSRQHDITPALHDPMCQTALIPGTEVCGTIVTLGTVADPYSVVNVAEGAKYRQWVRNVLTWSAGPVAEATWGPINIGDPVFYDDESDAANGVKLSTSPLDSTGAVNPRFGTVEMLQTEDEDDFPKGDAQAGSNNACSVMQTGLNHV